MPAPFPPVVFALGAMSLGGMPGDGRPEVAFVGRSNVGKSSLLNALAGRKALARVSGTPGKTREINFYGVGPFSPPDEATGAPGGPAFYLVDVPGLGYAKVAQTERAKWARLIEEYATKRATLRVLLHLIDCRHDPTEIDETVMDAVDPERYAVALTKADKLSGNTRAKAVVAVERVLMRHGLAGVPVLLTSAEDRRGIDALRAFVLAAATGDGR